MPHVFESGPIEVERFYTGVISQRNPLAIPIKVMGRRLIELYDAILSGQNAEISVRSTLQRACGYIPYNTNPISGIPQKFYDFKPISQPGVILPIVDSTAGIFYVPPGSTPPLSLIAKTQGKQSSFFGVGNYLYIGNQEFEKKWDGGSPQGLTNWGIAIGSINSAVGPNGTGTGTDIPVTSGVGWANPGNITANDGAFATTTLIPGGVGNTQTQNCGTGATIGAGSPGHVVWNNPNNITVAGSSTISFLPLGALGGVTRPLRATNFGFNIPASATINGIQATITRSSDTANCLNDAGVFLCNASGPVGSDHSVVGIWSTSTVVANYGTTSDLWGAAWTPALINANTFGIQIIVQNNGIVQATPTVNAFVTITVTYTTPSGGVAISDLLQGTNFGFAIPATNTVSGILVEIKGLQPVGNPSGAQLIVNLMKNGTVVGTAKGNVQLPTVNGFISLGGAGDSWGATFVPNDINQVGFGVSIQASDSGSTTASWSVDFVRVTIFGTGGPAVALVAGTLTATQGFQYVFTYGNSVDGNISNPTPPSLTIKPVAQGVQITLTASTDPQVNQIRVFRTTDTGTGAVFFELPTSPYPNVSGNVTDNAADNTLQVTQAVILSSLNFSPPPPGLVSIEWYAGRLWGAVGNLLYYAAGPDNTPMGNGQSNWPPQNVFVLPTQIVKLCALNGGNGMLVITIDGVHVVQGISNPGFTVNKWLSDVGARQQNAVDTDGSTIYIYTSDRQFLQLTSQGINELSQPVSDQTDTLDPTQVYVCQHRSGSQDSRVFLTDGALTIYPYNLMMGAWEPKRVPADGAGVGALGSIEILPGQYKLLKGSTQPNQIIEQRDLATFTDNGTTYPWNVVFGNIPLSDPTQLANLESLLLRMTNSGSLPVVGILANDVSGTFVPLGPPKDEPPEGNNPAQGYIAKKYYFGTGALWTQMSHLQVSFTFGAEAAQNEILSWGLFPNQSTDQQVGKIPEIQGR
jgi:hypothetical protein